MIKESIIMPTLLLLAFLLHEPAFPPTPRASEADSVTVYLFLLEECKITQAYTDRLGELYREFAGPGIGLIGLFPNPVSEDGAVAEFASKYALPFPCTREAAMSRAIDFGVSVTPEVVVYDETTGQVRYQGRIDNLFERVGKRRRVVSSHDLRDALLALREGREVARSRTTAVGCLLPRD